MRTAMAWIGVLVASSGCGNEPGGGDDDQNGVSGGTYAFAVTVDDVGFSPPIVTTENLAMVTLTLTNAGTKPHGFAIACVDGRCFPDAATIQPLAPHATATTNFATPRYETIYPFRSNAMDDSAEGDMHVGQFIIK
jgi:hypothetical protein